MQKAKRKQGKNRKQSKSLQFTLRSRNLFDLTLLILPASLIMIAIAAKAPEMTYGEKRNLAHFIISSAGSLISTFRKRIKIYNE